MRRRSLGRQTEEDEPFPDQRGDGHTTALRFGSQPFAIARAHPKMDLLLLRSRTLVETV